MITDIVTTNTVTIDTASSPPQPTYEDVVGFQPLLRAFRRARRAKRGRGGEPAFYRDLESNLLTLSAVLQARTWRPDPYHYFKLWTGKERVVSEASFRDRVVHHALVGALEPRFEAQFMDQSYACRRGRGLHCSLRRTQILSRQLPFFLRLDVRRYFDHIDHRTLMTLLRRSVADPSVLWLCETILASSAVPTPDATAQRGIPIGNLTSQFWANVYLDPLDHLLEREAGVGLVLRYMDDVLVFGDDKAALWRLAALAGVFLDTELGLILKASITRVAPVTEGVPWLGFSVFPNTTRLGRRARRRLARRLTAAATRLTARPAGISRQMQETREAPRSASIITHAAAANSLQLRRSLLRATGLIE